MSETHATETHPDETQRAIDDQEFERRVAEEVARREASRTQQAQASQEELDRRAREAADHWPARGYDGPPPWDIARVHGGDEHRLRIDPNTGTPVGAPVPYTGPAAVTHNEPTLTYGAAGDSVERLVGLLTRLGYRDERAPEARAAKVLDNSVMTNVQRFRSEHGLANSLDEFQGREVPAATLVEHHVGPYIWQALYTLADRQEA